MSSLFRRTLAILAAFSVAFVAAAFLQRALTQASMGLNQEADPAVRLISSDPSSLVSHPVVVQDGARFRLRLNADRASLVEVHAVNAAGMPSDGPIWSGFVAAGGSYLTPGFRVEGAPGLETVRVVQRSLPDGQVSQQQVRIWHD